VTELTDRDLAHLQYDDPADARHHKPAFPQDAAIFETLWVQPLTTFPTAPAIEDDDFDDEHGDLGTALMFVAAMWLLVAAIFAGVIWAVTR
jgi:hypothetical protein